MEYLKEMVRRDYSVYSSPLLEKYFVEKMKEGGDYSNIGTYWERGNQNQIDIVAVNDLKKQVVLAEVNRNKDRIKLSALEEKSKNIKNRFRDYEIRFVGLSTEDL